MMSMKTHSCTACSFSTLHSHFEWFVASDAKFMFALGTSKVHTASTGQGVLEFTRWAFHSMFIKMAF